MRLNLSTSSYSEVSTTPLRDQSKTSRGGGGEDSLSPFPMIRAVEWGKKNVCLAHIAHHTAHLIVLEKKGLHFDLADRMRG